MEKGSTQVLDLPLTVRSTNVLLAAGCNTVDDVLKFGQARLLVRPNMRERDVAEVVGVVGELGFKLV